jgi:hypothetical protein
MTIEKQNILEDWYSGNTKEIEITVLEPDDSPKDLTDSEVTFAMFTKGSEVVLVKSSATAEILLTDPLNGVMVVYINPPDTAHIDGTFYYQVNVVDASGIEETVTTGRINIFRSHAKRPRKNSIPAHLSA